MPDYRGRYYNINRQKIPIHIRDDINLKHNYSKVKLYVGQIRVFYFFCFNKIRTHLGQIIINTHLYYIYNVGTYNFFVRQRPCSFNFFFDINNRRLASLRSPINEIAFRPEQNIIFIRQL